MFFSNTFQERLKQALANKQDSQTKSEQVANKQDSQTKSDPRVLIDKWMGEIRYWRMQQLISTTPIEKEVCKAFIISLNDSIKDLNNFLKQEEELNQKK